MPYFSNANFENCEVARIRSLRQSGVIANAREGRKNASRLLLAHKGNLIMKIIRPQQLVKKTGLSRTTLWRLEKLGLLPPRIQLSSKAVGYDEHAIDEWLASRPVIGK
jgi:prophage regulatory protein